MQHRKTITRGFGWNRIPSARRHVYVYALLFLGAVVGNNLKKALTDPAENGVSPAAVRAEVSRLEGMKDSTRSLYH